MTSDQNLSALLRTIAGPTGRQLADARVKVAELRDLLETDSREQQRICDLGDLLDAEETLYDEAVAALDRGDDQLAERLLRQCSALGDEAAAEFLEDLLQSRQSTQEPSPVTAPEPDLPCALDRKIVVFTGGIASSNRPFDFLQRQGRLGARLDALKAAAECSSRTTWTSVRKPDQASSLHILLDACEASHELRYTAADLGMDWIGLAETIFDIKRYNRLRRRAQFRTPPCDYSDGVLLTYPDPTIIKAASLHQSTPQRVAADVLVPYPLQCIAPDEPIGEVLDYMVAADHQALPVGDQGVIFGIVTLVDLAGRTRAEQSHDPVIKIMHPPVFVQTNAPIDHVRDQLLNGSTGLVVALNSAGTVAGYITPQTALAGQTDPEPFSTRSSLLTGTGPLLLAKV